jgi:hypothetical protein
MLEIVRRFLFLRLLNVRVEPPLFNRYFKAENEEPRRKQRGIEPKEINAEVRGQAMLTSFLEPQTVPVR